MKTAIIVAMQKELQLLLPQLQDCTTATINDTTFHTGTMAGHKTTVMQCGIGKVNAAVGTLTLIDTFHPDIVINTGVAGGTGGTAKILDVVVASQIAYHDVWCGPGTVPGQAAGCPEKFDCPLSPRILARIPGIKTGLVASGDIFVSKAEDVRRILDMHPQTVAVDMESGAIAQVCHIKNVPFVCIRVVSDTPGQADNIAQYQNFWTDAPAGTFNALNALLALL